MKKEGKKFMRIAVMLVMTFAMLVTPIMDAAAGVIDGKIVVGDDINTGYEPTSEAHGEYTLDGPVSSGERSVFDAAANNGSGGQITVDDALDIDKVATFDEASGEGTITLTINANKPVRFSHYPPPRMDYVLVVDLTTSMTQPLRSVAGESAWQKFWDERTRIYQTREAIKEASTIIWASNPNSTITIVPFAGGGSGANYLKGVLTPNSTGNFKGFDYGAFSPSPSSFNTSGAATDAATLSYVHIPTSGPLSDPANYTSIAANKAITDGYRYYKLTRSDVTDSDFSDSIDALPLASGTSTAAGMTAALNILQSGTLAATDKENRVTILITDGGANVTDNGNYKFSQVLYDEAAKKMSPICADVKNPSKGNSTLSVVSIFPVPIVFGRNKDLYDQGLEGNTGKYAVYTSYDENGQVAWTDQTRVTVNGAPRPYTRPDDVYHAPDPGTDLPLIPDDIVPNGVLDVQNGPNGMCTNWAETPAHYYGADDSGQAVYNAIADSVRESVDFHAGLQGYLADALNTQYFEMDMSVEPTIKVSINGGAALSPGDAGFPSSIDVQRTADGLTADLGTLPYGDLLAASSKSTVTISYPFKIKDGVGAHFSELHTNIDDQTYLNVTQPSHDDATSSVATYGDDKFAMPFPTPVITLDNDENWTNLTVQKVDEDNKFISGSEFSVAATNKSTLSIAPVNASGETLLVEPNTTYTITETKTPANHEGLTAPVVVSVDASGIPTITSGSSSRVKLNVTSSTPGAVAATLVVTNAKTGGGGDGGGGGTDPETFIKMPLKTSVKPGDYIDYKISGFGNTKGKTLTDYAIVDLPPKGLNFVSMSLPAFTKGTGLTYDVEYRTNKRTSVMLKTDLSASKAHTVKAPALKSGEYITGIAVTFDKVPAGFGVKNAITVKFQVSKNPPTKTLVNRAALSYGDGGNTIEIDAPEKPVKVNGSGGNNGGGNVSTGDNTMLPVVALLITSFAAFTYLAARRRRSLSSVE